MKNLLLFIASLLFSTLFYKQNIGLNMLLFSIITTILIAILNFNAFKKKATLLHTSLFVFTAFLVFKLPSNLTIFTAITSFILLVGAISESKSAIYVKYLNGLYSTIVAVFAHYFDQINKEVEQVKKRKMDYIFWLKIIGIPILVLILFIFLYQKANPVFDDIITQIDLSFINLQWVLFTALGYYLLYNISNPISIEPITTTDLHANNTLDKENVKKVSDKKITSEFQLGLILLILLNILISFLLITDYIYLNSDINLDAVSFSERVHQGIYALIISIIFAIALIIYFFRGNLNFYQKNKPLKITTYIWILLNIVLIFTTALKNHMYIAEYGYTYKRIGVYVYLILALIGLIFTFIKVLKIKNMVYLFRKNTQISFGILIMASTINWDAFITNYNLHQLKNNYTDMPYLIHLSNNASTLKIYKDNNSNMLNLHSTEIEKKHNRFIKKLITNSWQEKVYANFKKH